MTWTAIIGVAVLFGLFYAYQMYRNFKKATDEEKPRLIKIYVGIAIISVIVFFGIKLFMPSQEIEYIDEQQEFQQEFIEDIIKP